MFRRSDAESEPLADNRRKSPVELVGNGGQFSTRNIEDQIDFVVRPWPSVFRHRPIPVSSSTECSKQFPHRSRRRTVGRNRLPQHEQCRHVLRSSALSSRCLAIRLAQKPRRHQRLVHGHTTGNEFLESLGAAREIG